MKKIVKLIIILFVIGAIGYLIYTYFINCENIKVTFDKEFILEKLDYGTTENGIIIKLMDIEDNHCKEDTCYKADEYTAKLWIIKNPNFSYIELGPMSKTYEKLEKINIEIALIDISDDGKVTLKVTNNEK